MSAKFFTFLLFSCLLLLSIGLPAQGKSANTVFKAGKLAYEQKQYHKAVELFQKTLLKGLQTPAVYHNLGVAAYKAELYSKAKIAFKENLNNNDWQSLAQYNLGLIAKKQNKLGTAQKWFTLASQNSSNATIQRAAQLILEKIDRSTIPNNAKDWFVLAQAGTGMEDNTIDVLQNEIQTTADNQFFELSLFGSKSWGNIKKGFDINASLYSSLNETNNDLSLASIGFERFISFAQNWKRYAGFSLFYTSYLNQAFQSSLSSHAKIKKSFHQSELIFRLQFQFINSLDPAYDYLAGQQWNIRNEFRSKSGKIKYRFFYDYEQNDRQDRVDLSYSPNRHRIQFRTDFPLLQKLQTRLSLDLRSSNYSNQAIAIARTDRRILGKFKTAYKLRKNLNVMVQYEYQKQNSLLNNYDYQRQRFTTGIEFFY